MRQPRTLAALALLILALGGTRSWAGWISLQSDNADTQGDGTGHFTASIDYVYSGSGTSATFIVVLSNTSAANTLGNDYITGFLFNNPGEKITKVTAGSPFDKTSFKVLFSNHNLKTQPWGRFDIGAAPWGGNWQGDGLSKFRIAPQSGPFTFTFNLTGTATDLASLSTQSFVDAGSTGGRGGSTFFAVRFRGGTSNDKERGILSGDLGPALPEPSGLTLLSIASAAFVSYFGWRWRKLAVA